MNLRLIASLLFVLAFAAVILFLPRGLYWMATASADADAVLVGAGDIADCASNGDEATAALLDKIPGTVVAIGDIAYENGTPQEFSNCYDRSWGRFKSRTRPVPGNHDYNTLGGRAYYDYFGATAGPTNKGYYSYNLGAWHIIALNSEIDANAGSEQEQWLRADLDTNQTDCTLAYWHKPRFSSGGNGGDPKFQALWQALYDYGADVVLAGHDHNYERFAPQTPTGILDRAFGIREFVVGTGGKSHSEFRSPVANSQVRNDDTYGVIKLTLHATGYDWEFIPEAGKTFRDSGSGTCHAVPPLPAPSITWVSDSFKRTVEGDWGSAEMGGTYTLEARKEDLGSAGRFIMHTPDRSAAAYLTAISALNVDGAFRINSDKQVVGAGHMVYLAARRVSPGNEYLARLRFVSEGGVMLQAVKFVDGAPTLLGIEQKVSGVRQSPDQNLWVRTLVVGTNPTSILIKSWADGQPEPMTWQYSVTDAEPRLQTAGAVGLRAYVAQGAETPITLTFKDFVVRSASLP